MTARCSIASRPTTPLGRPDGWWSTGPTRRRSSRWRATPCFAGGWPAWTPRRGGRSVVSSMSARPWSPTPSSSSPRRARSAPAPPGSRAPSRGPATCGTGTTARWRSSTCSSPARWWPPVGSTSSASTTCRSGSCRARCSPPPRSTRPRPSASSSGSRRPRSASPPSPTSVTTSVCRARTPRRAWPSWWPTGSWSRCRWRGGALPPTCGRRRGARGGSRPGRCCRRLTRSSGSALAPSGCSVFATGSRSTCPRPSGCTATTCCRSCSAMRWWRAWTSSQTARTAPCWSKGRSPSPGSTRTGSPPSSRPSCA